MPNRVNAPPSAPISIASETSSNASSTNSNISARWRPATKNTTPIISPSSNSPQSEYGSDLEFGDLVFRAQVNRNNGHSSGSAEALRCAWLHVPAFSSIESNHSSEFLSLTELCLFRQSIPTLYCITDLVATSLKRKAARCACPNLHLTNHVGEDSIFYCFAKPSRIIASTQVK